MNTARGACVLCGGNVDICRCDAPRCVRLGLPRCEGEVPYDKIMRTPAHRCTHHGRFEVDGKKYCAQHDYTRARCSSPVRLWDPNRDPDADICRATAFWILRGTDAVEALGPPVWFCTRHDPERPRCELWPAHRTGPRIEALITRGLVVVRGRELPKRCPFTPRVEARYMGLALCKACIRRRKNADSCDLCDGPRAAVTGIQTTKCRAVALKVCADHHTQLHPRAQLAKGKPPADPATEMTNLMRRYRAEWAEEDAKRGKARR